MFKTQTVPKPQVPPTGRRWRVLGWVGMTLFILLIGLVIAVLPPKATVVLIAGCTGLCALFFAWAFRLESNAAPARGFLLILLFLLSLSVLWPRYIFVSLGGPSANPLTLGTVATVGLIGLWFTFSPAFSRRLFDAWRKGGAMAWLIPLYMVWCLFVNLVGEEPLPSLVAYLRDLIYLGSFFLIGCALASFENGSRWTLRVLMVAALMVCGYGLLEAVMHKNFFFRFVAVADSKAMNDALTGITAAKMRGGDFRIQSTFDHPIVFAQFLGAIFPIAYYFMRYEKGLFWRLIGWMTIPLSLVCIIKTGSRAGIVAMAIGVMMVASIYWVRAVARGQMSRLIAIVALPALAIALFGGYLVVKTYAMGRTGAEAGSTQVRMHMLRAGVSSLTDSPIWGFGHGMAITKAGVVNPEGLATIDNYFLTIALNYGYVGLALWLAIIAIYVTKAMRAAMRLPGEEGVLIGVYAAAVLTTAAVFLILSIPNNLTLMWVLITTSFPLLGKAKQLTEANAKARVVRRGMQWA